MWPFRSTRDRIEMLRELRRPAPGTMWSWHNEPREESVIPSVSADLTEGTVTLSAGAVALKWERAAALGIAEQIRRAAESLDDSVDVDLSELEKRDG